MTDQYYICHFGILGQKWGIRRYQKYDGSYTQAGLKRYYRAKQDYEKAKESGDKKDIKTAKKHMNKIYGQLKYDKLADQGKELYSRGVTITKSVLVQQGAGLIMSFAVRQAAQRYFNTKNKEIDKTAVAVAIGSGAVGAILGIRNDSRNRKLRAYYAHKSVKYKGK